MTASPIPRTPSSPEPQPIKTTWVEWLPSDAPEPGPDGLIQRDELLRRLKRRGVDMSERTLQLWESAGIIPSPVRRWHEGAVRAVYPWWDEELVFQAHQAKKTPMRDRPWSLKNDHDIAQALRSFLTRSIRQASLMSHPFVQGDVTTALLGLGAIFNQGGLRQAAKVEVIVSDSRGFALFEMSVDLEARPDQDQHAN